MLHLLKYTKKNEFCHLLPSNSLCLSWSALYFFNTWIVVEVIYTILLLVSDLVVFSKKRITFHWLRHTSISLQISSGIQSQIISKRAGHSSVSVTHNIYSHFYDNGFKEVADKMDNFLHVKSV